MTQSKYQNHLYCERRARAEELPFLHAEGKSAKGFVHDSRGEASMYYGWMTTYIRAEFYQTMKLALLDIKEAVDVIDHIVLQQMSEEMVLAHGTGIGEKLVGGEEGPDCGRSCHQFDGFQVLRLPHESMVHVLRHPRGQSYAQAR